MLRSVRISKLVNPKTGQRAIKVVLTKKHSETTTLLAQQISKHSVGTELLAVTPKMIAFATDDTGKDLTELKAILLTLGLRLA